MNMQAALGAIKQLIGQGSLEEALEQLITVLDARPDLAELAQIIRVNQADFFQNKAQVLRGAISNDDARLANNQISSNVLYVIQRLDAGKTTLHDPRPGPFNARQRPWWIWPLVALMGVLMAVAGWLMFESKQDDPANPCPNVKGKIKVLVLQFRESSAAKNTEYEVDVMDRLNDLFHQDTELNGMAEAGVYKDNSQTSPTPTEALKLAEACGADMVVWGKSLNQSDTVEIRYKLVHSNARISITQDTALIRLLAIKDEGVWVKSAKNAADLLFLVTRSLSGTQKPMADNVRNQIAPPPPLLVMNEKRRWASVDTTYYISYADQFMTTNPDSTLHYLNQVLDVYPKQATALQKRSAIYMSKGMYEEAAKDLETLSPDPAKTDVNVQKLRIQAYVSSRQPEKARQDIQELQRKPISNTDKDWLKTRQTETDRIAAELNKESAALEQQVKTQPKDKSTQLKAAETQYKLGKADVAAKRAETILKTEPTNQQALQLAIDSYEMKGDTANAIRLVKEAERKQILVKSPRLRRVFITPLKTQ